MGRRSGPGALHGLVVPRCPPPWTPPPYGGAASGALAAPASGARTGLRFYAERFFCQQATAVPRLHLRDTVAISVTMDILRRIFGQPSEPCRECKALTRRLDDIELDVAHALELVRKSQRRTASLKAHQSDEPPALMPGEPPGLDPVSQRIWRRRNLNGQGDKRELPIPG